MPDQPAALYVFISYASVEQDRALAIADALEQAGIAVWLDRHAIAGGSAWSTAIVRAIRDCTAFLVLGSPRAFGSPNVQRELNLAIEENKPVVPLLLEQVTAPDDVRYALAGRQWVALLDRTPAVWLPEVLRALAGFGLLPGPPTDTESAQPTAPPTTITPVTNLPIPLTSFLGREQELTDLARLLHDTRLLTLTGPGGTGKTRLALAAARRVVGAFPDGVWFVDLSAVSDPAFVLVALAKVFDVRESQERPLAEALAAYLRRKRLLLVLDNFEQVVEAAPLLRDMLAAAPGVHLLVTSRVLLRLSGEHPYAVAPLPLPDAGRLRALSTLAANPAIQLFVQRTRTVRPDFALTAENAPTIVAICTALDGLPLALELAAARMKLLTASALLGRLGYRLQLLTGGERGVPQRQQTLRGAIEWSWELLEPAERVLFRQLAVFAGGFTLAAVEAVCVGVGDLGVDVLDGLTSLVEKSLVQQGEVSGEPRFTLLATLREFALERLAEAGEAEALGERHAGYYVNFAEVAGAALLNPEWTVWRPRVDAEHGNLRAVHTWAVAQQDAATALRLVGALWWWLLFCGGEDTASGTVWAEQALALPGADAPTAGRAAALLILGIMRFWAGDFHGSIAALREAAALFRALDRRRDLSILLSWLAMNYPPTSRTVAGLFEEALALAEQTGDLCAWSTALGWQAIHAWVYGDYVRARAGLEAGVAMAQRLTEPFTLHATLRHLAFVATEQEDPAAGSYVAQALASARAAGVASADVVETLALAGLRAVLAGNPTEAVAHAVEGLQLAEACGVRLFAYVWCIELLASAWTVQRQLPEQAARLLGATAHVREVGFTARSRRLASLVEQTNAALRGALGEAAFTAASAAGRGLSRDEAIAEALALAEEIAALPAEPSPVPSPAASSQRAAAPYPDGLTAREVEVLRLIATGQSTREIAAMLVISEATVTRHVTNLYGKIGARGRAGATAYAFRHALLAPST